LFTQFGKYKSSISCRDQEPPAIDGIGPGHVVTAECVAELSYPTGPARPVVSGSTRTQGGFVFYRPQLQMLVTGFSANRDEYGADDVFLSGVEVFLTRPSTPRARKFNGPSKLRRQRLPYALEKEALS
jgi:hypothetical protein